MHAAVRSLLSMLISAVPLKGVDGDPSTVSLSQHLKELGYPGIDPVIIPLSDHGIRVSSSSPSPSPPGPPPPISTGTGATTSLSASALSPTSVPSKGGGRFTDASSTLAASRSARYLPRLP